MVIARHLDPPDLEDIEIPDGLTVIRNLPNNRANGLIDDQVCESAGKGKSHLHHIFDLAFQGDAITVLEAVLKCAEEAGETELAKD